jgi:hypothetical protein
MMEKMPALGRCGVGAVDFVAVGSGDFCLGDHGDWRRPDGLL